MRLGHELTITQLEKPPNEKKLEIFSDSLKEASQELFSERTPLVLGEVKELPGNTRAVCTGNTLRLNEKFIPKMTVEELRRVAYHEVQHKQVDYAKDKSNSPFEFAKKWSLFALNPSVRPLFKRMDLFYNSKPNYPFNKRLGTLPNDFASFKEYLGEMNTYFGYNELLALLRGYAQSFNEDSSGNLQPYEFIEAFQVDDLNLLKPSTRLKLADEVLQNDHNLSSLLENHFSSSPQIGVTTFSKPKP